MSKDKSKVVDTAIVEDDKPIESERPKFTEEQEEYLGVLQARLEKARDNRDSIHREFDGLDAVSFYDANERGANTEIDPVKNKGETPYQSGTLRTKMMAFLSQFIRLNLEPDIEAYDNRNVAVTALGNAMEDVIDKTEEIDIGEEDEKRMLRQYELLKHGTVFVEDIWMDVWEKTKEMISGLMGNKDAKWKTEVKRALGHPRRKILPFLSVYLGSMREYILEDQPYAFIVEDKGWKEMEAIFGAKDKNGKDIWDMWQYVPKKKVSMTDGVDMASTEWSLIGDEDQENTVQKIVYQDKPNNEIQIILNGIPMLPMGYPLTEVSPDGEYTFVQQNLEPIRHNFALGKSFIFNNKNIVAVLDMMLRLAVLKTKQSFKPPMLNQGDALISGDIMMPGKITRGVMPGDLVPVNEHLVTGVTNSEFNMIAELKKGIDEKTVSPTATGSMERGGDVTATQINEMQKQAQVMMGLLELSATLLEKKLAKKRLSIILAKWFDPIDEVVDVARDVLKNKYRVVSSVKNMDNVGKGLKVVAPSDQKYSKEQVKKLEDNMSKSSGMPVRITLINPQELKQMLLTWIVNVRPREKRSSDYSKLLFRGMAADAMALGLQMNPELLPMRFAEVWDEDPKMFAPAPQQQDVAPPQGGRVEAPSVKPKPNAPQGL